MTAIIPPGVFLLVVVLAVVGLVLSSAPALAAPGTSSPEHRASGYCFLGIFGAVALSLVVWVIANV